MADLIDRQAAIDRFEPWLKVKGYNEGELNMLKAVVYELKCLPSAQPEPKWIPCSERLPKAAVRYLVTFESGEVGYSDFRNKIFLWDGSVKENVWETEPYYEDDGEVIAWMELPSPYKEEKR